MRRSERAIAKLELSSEKAWRDKLPTLCKCFVLQREALIPRGYASVIEFLADHFAAAVVFGISVERTGGNYLFHVFELS